jgi:threonine/homoserine/homoserine lactone efflux protein
MVQSPLTVGILFVLIGYYLCYYGWLLWKAKHIAPEDLETAAGPPPAAPAQSDVTPR